MSVPRSCLTAALTLGLAACGSRAEVVHVPGCPAGALDVWTRDPRLCLTTFAAELGRPRQLAIAANGDVLVNNGAVTVLFDDDHDGVSGPRERAQLATAPGLNHGLALSRDGRYVYASSATTVYRWPYTTGARALSAPAERVVTGIPDGGHTTRTLVFDSQGRLYVSVGSATNVDVDPTQRATRSQIRRYALPDPLPDGGLAYLDGEVVAAGMRNEVGLYMDRADRLWGVENGRDNLATTTDIHNDNPAERVNLVDGTGARDYGYPRCFVEYQRAGGGGPGTLWADPALAPADRKTDDWCRDPANVHPPVFAMPAHWAPLGVLEYQGSQLPFGHDLIVTAHGSWNRDPAVGRLIARLRRDGDAITAVEPLVGERGADRGLREGAWSARPVDVREADDGSLLISDDNGGRVLRLTYAPPP